MYKKPGFAQLTMWYAYFPPLFVGLQSHFTARQKKTVWHSRVLISFYLHIYVIWWFWWSQNLEQSGIAPATRIRVRRGTPCNWRATTSLGSLCHVQPRFFVEFLGPWRRNLTPKFDVLVTSLTRQNANWVEKLVITCHRSEVKRDVRWKNQPGRSLFGHCCGTTVRKVAEIDVIWSLEYLRSDLFIHIPLHSHVLLGVRPLPIKLHWRKGHQVVQVKLLAKTVQFSAFNQGIQPSWASS